MDVFTVSRDCSETGPLQCGGGETPYQSDQGFCSTLLLMSETDVCLIHYDFKATRKPKLNRDGNKYTGACFGSFNMTAKPGCVLFIFNTTWQN